MKIQFEAGTNANGRGINYLICMDDKDLYAEIEVPEGASEDFGYFVLKQEIIAKAAEKGIGDLEFWYDGQEDKLAPDADGIVRWYAVQRDPEDDWGTGSFDREEAKEMLRKIREDYPDALIAVIDNRTGNPVCLEEIREI